MQVLRKPTATGCQHLCVDAEEEEEEEGRRSIASTRMQELVLLSLQAAEFGGFVLLSGKRHTFSPSLGTRLTAR